MKRILKKSLMITVAGSLLLAGCSGGQSEPAAASSEAVSAAAAAAETETAADTQAASPAEAEKEEAPQAGATEASAAVETESNDGYDAALEAYAAFITRQAEEAETPFLYYTLIHLDEDDMPELAVSYDDSHPAGVTFYGYDGSAVNELYSSGSLGVAYYEKGSGVIFGWYTGQGETMYNIGNVKNGKLDGNLMPVVAIQYDDNFEETGYRYFVEELNGEAYEPYEITKEKFDEMLTPYLPENREYKELRFGELREAHQITDTLQGLKDSLAEEDSLPGIDMEWYQSNVIIPDAE